MSERIETIADVIRLNAPPDPAARHITTTFASHVTPRATEWAWEGRMPDRALALIAGPEGTGKTTCAYWLAAQITRGTLPGVHYGQPKVVLIAATEDSWAHTIVPRLIAAGADLDRVARIEVTTGLGVHATLSLPRDIAELERVANQHQAALLLLDPLMSRLDTSLDSHRDGETRQALEPIAAVADRTGMAVVGLIHFNKSGSPDLLGNVMASKAFTAVARSVSMVIRDPHDDTGRTRIFATPKNNLGRDDLPLMPFTIEGFRLDVTDPISGKPIDTSRVVWQSERPGDLSDLLAEARDTTDRSAVAEAAEWLREHLESQGGEDTRAAVIKAGQHERYTEKQLDRAARRIAVARGRTQTFPSQSLWSLPQHTEQET